MLVLLKLSLSKFAIPLWNSSKKLFLIILIKQPIKVYRELNFLRFDVIIYFSQQFLLFIYDYNAFLIATTFRHQT